LAFLVAGTLHLGRPIMAMMKLREDLGIPRNKHINTDKLRELLKDLVEDETKDDLAMKVFGLILYMKFICPGYSVRVTREAPMVYEKSIPELKDVDLCQLLVDELKRAIIAWQKAGAHWRAVPGCGIALLLMHLDNIDHRKLNPIDHRTPRILYLDTLKLRALAKLDCVVKGSEDPRSWIFGSQPVRFFTLPLLFCINYFVPI